MKQVKLTALAWVLGAGLLCSTFSASALELKDAKEQGLVGETPSGYLAAVGTADATVQQLITSINQQRKEKYQEIAGQKGIGVQEVEQIAGNVAIQKTEKGQYIKTNGQWVKK